MSENGAIADIFDEYPESYAALPVYLSEYYNSKELEVWDGLSGAARQRKTVNMDQLWKIGRSALLNHGFYSDFLKQVGHFHGLHRSIYIDGKPRGLLQIKRTLGDQSYQVEDVKKLDHIAPHIEHAIKNQNEVSSINDSVAETASLIVDGKGKIHHYSDQAERIIMLSQGNREFSAYSRFS